MIKNINILRTVDIINNSIQPYEGERKYLDTGGLKTDKIKEVRGFDFVSKPSRANQNVEIGDIILARMKDTIKVKIISKIESDYMVSTGFIILRPKKNIIDTKFLNHLLLSKSFQRDKDELCSGATQKAINNGNFKKLEIPLPPVDQQKKIAAILDAADTYRQKTKALITKYDELTQSLFLDMFGDPVTNPKKWEILTIEKVLDAKSQNGHYSTKDEYLENGVEMVHMSDAFYHKVVPGELKKVKVNDKLILKYGLKSTDVLLSRRSLTYEGAAQPCLIPEYDKPLIYESSLIRLRPKLNVINTLYLHYFLSNSRARQKYVFKHVTKSTISGINNKGLNAIKIIVPKINLQNQFAERVKAIEVQKTQAEASLVQADNLFNSLLQRAFKGELV